MSKLTFIARTGQLFANSEPTPFYIKGINWKGAETQNLRPSGLHVNDLDWYLDLLVRCIPSPHLLGVVLVLLLLGCTQNKLKFNAIRLHFSHQSVLRDPKLSVDDDIMPEWDGITYQSMLADLVSRAERYRILIILVSSRLSELADLGTKENGLWYNSEVNEMQIFSSWEMLAKRFCDKWNVVGVDLQDEVTANANLAYRAGFD